jgi:hypothetical protein
MNGFVLLLFNKLTKTTRLCSGKIPRSYKNIFFIYLRTWIFACALQKDIDTNVEF